VSSRWCERHLLTGKIFLVSTCSFAHAAWHRVGIRVSSGIIVLFIEGKAVAYPARWPLLYQVTKQGDHSRVSITSRIGACREHDAHFSVPPHCLCVAVAHHLPPSSMHPGNWLPGVLQYIPPSHHYYRVPCTTCIRMYISLQTATLQSRWVLPSAASTPKEVERESNSPGDMRPPPMQ
jgi:hypothetical protein